MSRLIQSGLPCTDCPSHDAMSEYEDGTYCFSCTKRKYKKREKAEDWSQFQTVQIEKELSGNGETWWYECDGFPKSAKKILLKAGITPEQAFARGWRYTDKVVFVQKYPHKVVTLTNRLVLPIVPLEPTREGFVRGFQFKAINPRDKPKYITVGTKGVYYLSKQQLMNGNLQPLIIVEDIMSALRVHMAGYDVVALLGTSLSDENLLTLINSYCSFKIWLDDDGPGIKARQKLIKRIRLHCDKVKAIKYGREPKQCTDREILKVITEC